MTETLEQSTRHGGFYLPRSTVSITMSPFYLSIQFVSLFVKHQHTHLRLGADCNALWPAFSSCTFWVIAAVLSSCVSALAYKWHQTEITERNVDMSFKYLHSRAPIKASAGVTGLITEEDFKEYTTSLCQELAAVCIARGSSVV